MQKIPQKLKTLLQKISVNFPKLIDGNLVGIYISGSLTYNAFNDKSSDVDLIVVLNNPLSNFDFKKLQECLKNSAKTNLWVSRLQILFLIKDAFLVKGSSRDEFHEGELKRGFSDANPIILLNLVKSGIVLYGLKPKTFVPKISKKILHDALHLEVAYLKEGFSTKKKQLGAATLTYQVFAVLTLCRIFYTFKKGTITSKKNAAQWCIKNLHKEWKPIVMTALKNANNKSVATNPTLEESVPSFIRYIEKKLR